MFCFLLDNVQNDRRQYTYFIRIFLSFLKIIITYHHYSGNSSINRYFLINYLFDKCTKTYNLLIKLCQSFYARERQMSNCPELRYPPEKPHIRQQRHKTIPHSIIPLITIPIILHILRWQRQIPFLMTTFTSLPYQQEC